MADDLGIAEHPTSRAHYLAKRCLAATTAAYKSDYPMLQLDTARCLTAAAASLSQLSHDYGNHLVTAKTPAGAKRLLANAFAITLHAANQWDQADAQKQLVRWMKSTAEAEPHRQTADVQHRHLEGQASPRIAAVQRLRESLFAYDAPPALAAVLRTFDVFEIGAAEAHRLLIGSLALQRLVAVKKDERGHWDAEQAITEALEQMGEQPTVDDLLTRIQGSRGASLARALLDGPDHSTALG